MRTRLSVNVNKIAWLRNARDQNRPDLVGCCKTIIAAGAEGITVHPRPDQRHIRVADVYAIAECLVNSSIEYNIEGNPHAVQNSSGYVGFLKLVHEVRPTQCTLVPDSDHQLTSDHGWDLTNENTLRSVREIVKELTGAGIRTSLFMEPDVEQIEFAATTGTDRVELFTGPWAVAVETYGKENHNALALLNQYRAVADRAYELGMSVNAGHDLDMYNLDLFCRTVQVAEVSIGQALISDALELGLRVTVEKYQTILKQSSVS